MDAFEKAAENAREGETLWAYEADVPIVHGVVAAPRGNRDAALASAVDDAQTTYGQSLAAATWSIREITP